MAVYGQIDYQRTLLSCCQFAEFQPGQPDMHMRSFDLAEISTAERFSYWRDVLCNLYVALDPETSSRIDFRGAVTDHPFDEIGISNIASLKQTIARTSKGIRRDTNAYCFLNLQVAGTCRIHQGNRHAITMPGEFTIVDSSEPFLLDYIPATRGSNMQVASP